MPCPDFIGCRYVINILRNLLAPRMVLAGFYATLAVHRISRVT